jgi:hypothetical protein
VRVNRESYEIFERMHYVCFHFEFEHMGYDPYEECDAPGCPSSPFNSPPHHTAELLAMVPCAAESVLRRGRAVMELGRRAADDPALLTEVAALIRDPANRRLITSARCPSPSRERPGLSPPAANRQRPWPANWPPSGRPSTSPTSPA